MDDAMNSALGGLAGGMPWQGGSQDPLLSMFGGLAAQQQQQLNLNTIQHHIATPEERREEREERWWQQLSFIDKLRIEIDNWLKS